MTNFNMKIANRAPKSKNGCYPFSEESIKNIPDIDIFIEDEINSKIKLACQDVLRRSMQASNKYRYGEMGILISTLDDKVCERFSGEYHSICTANTKYNDIIYNRNNIDLIFVHNHPNNEPFSASDLINLRSYRSLLGVVAVGNRHNVFLVIKDNNKLASKISKHITIEGARLAKQDNFSKPNKYYRDIIAQDILNNKAKQFGLDYIVLRRKSK